MPTAILTPTFIGTVGDTDVYRIDLTESGLADIGTITILDGNSSGGDGGSQSGLDVDFVKLSATLTGDAAAVASLVNEEAFDFSRAGVIFKPGFLRPWSEGENPAYNKPYLSGTSANAYDPGTATLGVLDSSYATDTGAISLGEGGQISLALKYAISVGAKYLYIGDRSAGDNDEAFSVIVDQAPIQDAFYLVDDQFYLARYADVRVAGVDADAHYAAFGWQEGRDPNAFFSTNGYLSANQDADAANINPIEHYHQNGWKEGRDASVSFDTTLYLLHNPDVTMAAIDPLEHYLAFGRAEGRQAHEAVGQRLQGTFDAEYYLLANPDVGAAGVDAAFHFATFGWKEGRDPNAFFDTSAYLAAYGDVAAAGINPLEHYNSFGWKEGRDPSGEFDTTAYLATYADVAAAGVNPLQHYLQFGIYEGRQAFGDAIIG